MLSSSIHARTRSYSSLGAMESCGLSVLWSASVGRLCRSWCMVRALVATVGTVANPNPNPWRMVHGAKVRWLRPLEQWLTLTLTLGAWCGVRRCAGCDRWNSGIMVVLRDHPLCLSKWREAIESGDFPTDQEALEYVARSVERARVSQGWQRLALVRIVVPSQFHPALHFHGDQQPIPSLCWAKFLFSRRALPHWLRKRHTFTIALWFKFEEKAMLRRCDLP
jgi:hypothetical protein